MVLAACLARYRLSLSLSLSHHSVQGNNPCKALRPGRVVSRAAALELWARYCDPPYDPFRPNCNRMNEQNARRFLRHMLSSSDLIIDIDAVMASCLADIAALRQARRDAVAKAQQQHQQQQIGRAHV